MYRTIMVPLDGSSVAERAFPYAQSLARTSGARLLLIRVVPDSAPNAVDFIDSQDKAMRDAEEYLDVLSAQAADRPPVGTAVYHGDPVEMIVAEAKNRPIDIVV